MRSFLLIVILLFLLSVPRAWSEDRIPRPEFQTEYEIPQIRIPRARTLFEQYMDVAVLVLSLAMVTSAMAADGMARARVVHASPNAPA